MTPLEVKPCSFEAAEYAVMNWHYSRSMPSGKLIKFGIWENQKFIGSIIYGRGATKQLGDPYGLDQTEVCELVRIALTNHQIPVSQIVAKTIREIRKSNPGIRLIVSFADPEQNHHGGIYQAGNWVYSGQSISAPVFKIKGKIMHGRSVNAKYGTKRLSYLKENIDPMTEMIYKPGKHRYLYPLDKPMRRKIQSLVKPYPRGSSLKGETADFQSARPGSIPGNRSNS